MQVDITLFFLLRVCAIYISSSVCLSTCLSLFLSVDLIMQLARFSYSFIYSSIHTHTCCVYLNALCMAIFPSLSVCLLPCLSIYHIILVPTYLSAYSFVFLFTRLFIYLDYLSASMPALLSICSSFSLSSVYIVYLCTPSLVISSYLCNHFSICLYVCLYIHF